MDQRSLTNTNSLPAQSGLLVFIFGFLGGVCVASFIFVSPLVSLLVCIVAVAVFIAEKVFYSRLSSEAILLSVTLFAVGLGMFRYSVKDFHEIITPLNSGIVVSEPEQKENTTRFVLKSDNGERVLVSTDLYSPVSYGDRVEVSGQLEEPGIIDDGVGRPFDYAKYLAKDDIYYVLNFAETEVVSSGHGNPVKSVLLKIKQNLVSKIRMILAEPESSLLAGLIVAGKASMPKNILDNFRHAGVIHIVVLSGYNITIIADFMRRVFGQILMWTRFGTRPQVSALASIAGVLIFVLMTGGEATVVRAALMVLVVIAAKGVGRNYSASRALLAAGFLMVLHNPKILVFDPSFQLSFIATLALIYLAPITTRYLGFVTEKFEIRSMIATTLATQIAVLPYLVYSTGEVSLVSLPANILILLLIPYTMLVGFTAALVSYISVYIALPLTYLAHLMLAWILGVSSFLGNLPFAVINI